MSHPVVKMSDMTRQLRLIDKPTPWKLDPATRDRGRQGVREARVALAAAPTLFELSVEAA